MSLGGWVQEKNGLPPMNTDEELIKDQVHGSKAETADGADGAVSTRMGPPVIRGVGHPGFQR
jgi:hypothetical protein